MASRMRATTALISVARILSASFFSLSISAWISASVRAMGISDLKRGCHAPPQVKSGSFKPLS